MAQWIEQREGHPVWKSLPSTIQRIEEIIRAAKGDDAISELERFADVLRAVEANISAADIALLPLQALGHIFNALNTLDSQLCEYANSHDASVLNICGHTVDSILTTVAGHVTSPSPSELSGLITQSAEYRSQLTKALAQLRRIHRQASQFEEKNEEVLGRIRDSFVDEQRKIAEAAEFRQAETATQLHALEGEIARLREQIASEQTKLNFALVEHQTQFSGAQDFRASEFTRSQSEFFSAANGKLSEYQSQFSAEQDNRRTQFTELQSNISERSKEMFHTHEKSFQDYQEQLQANEIALIEKHRVVLADLDRNFVAKAEDHLNTVKRHLSDVEKLVGVIGNLGVTSGFKKLADHARTMQYVWQAITVVSLSVLVVLAFGIAFPEKVSRPLLDSPHIAKTSDTSASVSDSDNSAAGGADANVRSVDLSDSQFYRGFVSRVFLSVALGVLATYAARQASHFMKTEQKSRQRALELEALGPFIEPLEKADRDKFRIQVGDRSFAVADLEKSDSRDPDPASPLGMATSKELLEFLEKIKSIISSPAGK